MRFETSTLDSTRYIKCQNDNYHTRPCQLLQDIDSNFEQLNVVYRLKQRHMSTGPYRYSGDMNSEYQ